MLTRHHCFGSDVDRHRSRRLPRCGRCIELGALFSRSGLNRSNPKSSSSGLGVPNRRRQRHDRGRTAASPVRQLRVHLVLSLSNRECIPTALHEIDRLKFIGLVCCRDAKGDAKRQYTRKK